MAAREAPLPVTWEFQVVGEEDVSLGDCHYRTLVIEQLIKEGGQEVDKFSLLYSPDLEITLAKRYDGDTVRFMGIFPLTLR